VTQAGASTSHVYTSPGTYTPSLVVSDSSGARSAAIIARADVTPADSTGGGTGGGTGSSGGSGGGAFAPGLLPLLLAGAALRRRRNRRG